MNWKKRIDASLKKQQIENTLRSRIAIESNIGRFLVYNKKKYYNFSSNDYLGLRYHPKIIYAWKKGIEHYGIGSGGSGHISGYTSAHLQFEEELADWMQYPRALLFSSGFAANQAVISTLMKKNDHIIADKFSHISLINTAFLSSAKLRRFHHNNVKNLVSILQKPRTGQLLVVTEGIFSMEGDSAPLEDLYQAVRKENGWLLVDDAHGFGVIGKEGRGSCHNQQIKPELLIITFGKAAGICGAAVLCNEDVADYLLQHAHHLIYSTIMPPAQAVALLASLNVIRSTEGEERRQKLIQNIRQFRNGIENDLIKMYLSDSNCAIQPLIIGDNIHAISLAAYLQKKNIWTVAIRPPTVPKNTARLRITLSASHEPSDIITLLEILNETNK